jgi:site-specific recombinase XerD
MTRAGGCAAGLPGEFGVRPEDIPPPIHLDGPGRALPNEVMNALNDALPSLETKSGRASRVTVEILMDTGSRPDEVCQLPLDCLERDGDGKYVLVYTDYKENRLHRRLPIPDSTAALIRGQQAAVREAFPDTDPRDLVLIPAASANPQGTKSLRATGLTNLHRIWVDQLPEFRLTDGGIFPHAAVVAYAYRHTYAQRHADAGTPIEVLRELMGHRSVHSTEAYYRITEVRTRAAVTRVADHQFDGSGNRVWRQVTALLDSERARMRVGQVAVPYGTCTEPSNVQAGGCACPFRFRCLGCGHFRTDVSYLPELRSHLDRLLADRERVIAATELEPWARTEAAPSDAEIDKVRALIRRLDDHVDDLTQVERDQITEAIGVLRTTLEQWSTSACRSHRRAAAIRAMSGQPADDPNTHRIRVRAGAAFGTSPPTRHRTAAPAGPPRDHRTDVDRRTDHRVIDRARAARVHRSFIHRHQDLHAAVLAAAAVPAEPASNNSAVSVASLRADLLNARAHNTRLQQHIRALEGRLSESLGEAVFRDSGLGAPDHIHNLQQALTDREQQVLELRRQLEERAEELAAARAANRELMTQLNTRQ